MVVVLVMDVSMVCSASKEFEWFTKLLKIDTSSSPTSLNEFVLHGDSSNEGKEGVVGCDFFPLELFLKTLQTTHSSYKKTNYINI